MNIGGESAGGDAPCVSQFDRRQADAQVGTADVAPTSRNTGVAALLRASAQSGNLRYLDLVPLGPPEMVYLTELVKHASL